MKDYLANFPSSTNFPRIAVHHEEQHAQPFVVAYHRWKWRGTLWWNVARSALRHTPYSIFEQPYPSLEPDVRWENSSTALQGSSTTLKVFAQMLRDISKDSSPTSGDEALG
jgi:hypothetical protein